MKKNFPITLSLVVLAAATLWFVVQANYEFLLYAVTLLVLIGIVFWLNRRFEVPAIAKWGFAVNEIIEFAAVVLFQADGVGGYHNTCIDLVANLLGAMVSTVYLAAVRAF